MRCVRSLRRRPNRSPNRGPAICWSPPTRSFEAGRFPVQSKTAPPRGRGCFGLSCSLCLHLEQDDDQGEQSEGLDEREAEDQEDHQATTCTGVACQRLASRSRGLALAKTAKPGRAMPMPAPMGARLTAALPPPACANAGTAKHRADRAMNTYCSFRIVLQLHSNWPPVGG